MREQFEELPEIASKLHHVKWNEKHEIYHAKVCLDAEGEVLSNIRYVTGAWYAFQEQQKKIDVVLQKIAEQQADYGKPAWVYLEEIKELLK